MKRRSFLRGSLVGAIALTIAGVALQLTPSAGAGKVLSGRELAILVAIVRRMCGTDIPADEVARFGDNYLAQLDGGMQRDVRALLFAVEHFGWQRFTARSTDTQDEILRAWQTSRFAFRRQGFVALKTLACLGYYRDPRSWRAIGYSGPTLR